MLSSANQVYASLRRFVPNSVDFPSKTFGNNQKGFKKVSYNFVLSFFIYSGERGLGGKRSLNEMLQARFKFVLYYL